MKRILKPIIIMVLVTGFFISFGYAQLSGSRGSFSELRRGVHSGNQFRVSFFNDGTYGVISPYEPGLEYRGEWPINSGYLYLVDGNIFVGSEVLDNNNNFVRIITENISANIGGSRGDQDPLTGEWWTFLPLPGFANPNNDLVAMAKGAAEWKVPDANNVPRGTWPPYWPDIADPDNDLFEPTGWAGAWNGYFGRNQFNADEESYFVADDYNNREFNFFPDSNITDRRGLGLRLYVRGFQWAKSAVEDALFCLYDIENIGTYRHDKMVFAYKIGNNMGDDEFGGAGGGNDWAWFLREENLAYMWEQGCHPELPEIDIAGDCVAPGGWSPVGFIGGAFLESPGNPYDGIDNDNDGAGGSGINITENIFNQPLILQSNTELVLINYDSYSRKTMTLGDTLANLGSAVLTVRNGVRVYNYSVGDTVMEIGDNLIDDNFNGLIDENRNGRDADNNINYLYIQNGLGYKAVDYFTGAGLDNLLLDERRDDGIDNDGDWEALTDDVGRDGIAPGGLGYPGPDDGEGDGVPTPGEPHFDATDIDESDQIGLTSVALYEWTLFNQYDDEAYWTLMIPGTAIIPDVAQNVELSFGSGYFPLIPGQTERISIAVVLGSDYGELMRNKGYVAEAYGLNYNFAKAPYLPTVRAVAGDNKVTLFWDAFAESSIDPIGQRENGGLDFEGYKIYRSTHPSFTDAKPITNAFGDVIMREPLAQFDLINEKSGLHSVATQGVHFNLGSETGITHYYIDETAINGYTYFYAVTAYDHGDEGLGIDPSETTKFVAITPSGVIDKGTNVVVVRPSAPAAGYNEAALEEGQIVPSAQNTTDGNISFRVLDPDSILDNNLYEVTFYDTLVGTNQKSTHSFKLTNLTSNTVMLDSISLIAGLEGTPMVDGFQLAFSNNPEVLDIDTSTSGWSRSDIVPYVFGQYSFRQQPIDPTPIDFQIIFDEVGIDTSKEYYRANTLEPAIPVNFTIINTITGEKVDFAFRERHIDSTGIPGKFSLNFANRQSDEIIMLANADSQIASWWIRMDSPVLTGLTNPRPGDVLTVSLFKPFLAHDSYQFVTKAGSVDKKSAKNDLDNIRVVPNPYIVTNSWEPRNPYSTGRGDRQLQFIHLPEKCTIRIFNVRGQLINTLHHDAPAADGTEIWNMLSKDNLEISYGIYIYHVKAEGVGEKIGKFLVVK